MQLLLAIVPTDALASPRRVPPAAYLGCRRRPATAGVLLTAKWSWRRSPMLACPPWLFENPNGLPQHPPCAFRHNLGRRHQKLRRHIRNPDAPSRVCVVFSWLAWKSWIVRYPVSSRLMPYLQVEPSLHGTYVMSRFRPMQTAATEHFCLGGAPPPSLWPNRSPGPPSSLEPVSATSKSSQRSPRSVGCSGISFFRQSFEKFIWMTAHLTADGFC